MDGAETLVVQTEQTAQETNPHITLQRETSLQEHTFEPSEQDISDVSRESQEKLVTSKEVIDWLRSNQKPFIEALRGFGIKRNMGFQEIKVLEEEGKILLDQNQVPKIEKHSVPPGRGEFTGAGLCAIACGALEEALRRKFGTQIETMPVVFDTEDMDKGLEERFLSPHHILRFKVTSETEGYFVDPTYRQFLMRVNPDKMLLIAPRKAAEKLYTYQSIYEQKKNPDSLPREPYRPGELLKSYLQNIRQRFMTGLTEKDFYALVDSFDYS